MGKKSPNIKAGNPVDDTDVEKPLSAELSKETNQLPRKHSVVWIAFKSVKTKLSLTDEGATPVNWKCIFLVFISLVKLMGRITDFFF